MASPRPRQNKSTSDVFDARATKETHHLTPHPTTGRLIDNHPGKRIIPMRVLMLGMSRTGTMSIFTALEQLGYRPYHMSKAIQAPKSNLDVWREGLNAKFHGIGNPWGREEFDKILGEYDCVADVPCICFAEELIAAYPDAKVILSTRDVEEWLVSMDSSAGVVLRWKGWEWLSRYDPALVEPFWEHAKVVMPAAFGTFSDFSGTSPARRKFEKHYENVRKVTPKGRLLEYRVQEGWEPLCDFLGKDVPEESFPRINDKKQFLFAHGVMWWLAFGKMVVKTIWAWGPVLAGGLAWWKYG